MAGGGRHEDRRRLAAAVCRDDVALQQVDGGAETSDPAMGGEMTITITLADAGDGTDLVAVHAGLPPGVTLADNELGWRLALDKLAALVESA